MLVCCRASLSFTDFRFGYSCFLFLPHLQMPKYAVARGRNVGIYDTYDECKLQVQEYPNARYKKFNTKQEAEDFIRDNSTLQNCYSDADAVAPSLKENIFKPELIKVEKISPSDINLNTLNNKMNLIEQKLNNFISSATNLLESLSSRIKLLEGKRSADCNVSCEPPNKKPKVQDMTNVNNFLYTDSGFVKVYTDGACSKNGKMGAMAGIGVWFNEDHPLNVSQPVKGPPTNNTAEIQAARIAISQAYRAGVKKLSIHTDSQFLINCITQWIHKWKKNEWHLSSGGPVKNKDELVKLDEAIQSVEAVEWIHVAGHQGILGNEMADSLARKGALQYKTNITYALSADE